MSFTVRKLTPAEQEQVRKILQDLQAHVAGCERCQDASSSRNMCLAGAELYARWDQWLAADSAALGARGPPVKTAVLYARVSTADKGQDWRAQLEELRRVCTQREWRIVSEYHDVTSGAKASRPGLEQARFACRLGGVQIFAAVSVDRVGRLVLDLLKFVGELEALNVRLACTREGDMDTTTPQGAAFLQMRGIFAELERKFIAQRIREALAVRRARGQRLGRQPTLDYSKLPQAQRMRRRRPPASWRTISNKFGGTPGAWSLAVTRATKAGSERRRPATKATGAS